MTNVTVVGLGREGLAVTRVLATEGARVTVSDQRDRTALAAQLAALDGLPITLSLGGNRPDEALRGCDLLVLSPAVDKRAPIVREAVRRGIPISSETELFFDRCRAPIAGITGSAGKTTTTTLVGEMLRRDGRRPVFVGGNIGQPLSERLGEITPDAWVVLELSSFQLEWLRVSPSVALVTNVTPNHLDRHETIEAYTEAKANILAHQGPDGVAVLNRDDPGSCGLAGRVRGRLLYFSLTRAVEAGAYLDGERLVLARDGERIVLCGTSDLRVPGRHNMANALAAVAVAGACGADPAAMEATLRQFTGVPHRLQRVGAVRGVTYYDDSIATAPERTLAALATLAAPIVLILGGRDKHLPWDDLARAALTHCRGVVLIGEAAPLIREHLEGALAEAEAATAQRRTGSAGFQPAYEDRQDAGAPSGGAPSGGAPRERILLRREAIVDAGGMDEAVRHATALARPGDAVALAPGCTSYDMYRDFEERGDDFARAVRRLESDV